MSCNEIAPRSPRVRPRIPRRHTRVIAGCACALSLAVAPPASAHGGTPVLRRAAGPYRVAVDARAVSSGGRVGAVDYTLSLERRSSGKRVLDARIALTAETPDGGIGPLVARLRDGAYTIVIPVAPRQRWETYRLRIRVGAPGQRAVILEYRPPAPSFTWRPQPIVLAGASLVGALYARAFLRLRRRGRRDLASAARCAAFAAGLACAVFAAISPIDPVGEDYLLSVHMCQHVLLGDVSPALIVAGLSGPLGLFVPPRSLLQALAGSRTARRVGTALLNPVTGLGIWAAVYAGWHVPVAYEAALGDRGLHDLEHASFFAAGLLVWTMLIDPLPRSRRKPRTRMGLAIALLLLGSLLSDVLLLAPHPLYRTYADQPVRLWGISALTDQRVAGAAMMVEQLASLTLCMAFLVVLDRRARATPPGRVEARAA